MKRMLRFAVLGGVLNASAAQSQDPVASLLKTQHLSTIPGVYQAVVEPGGILILRDKGHTVAYEDASDASEQLKKRAASITLAKTELAKVDKVTLALKLFGYEPGISFSSGTELSYDAAVLSGTRLTGFQMTKLVTSDPETIQNIAAWLYNGYRVYLIESVMATPSLYVSSAKSGGLSLALNKTATPCSTTAPPLPAPANTSASTTSGSAGQSSSSSKDDEKKAANKTTADAKDKAGDDKKDGTQDAGGSAIPISVEASICPSAAGHYALTSPTPVNIAVKLQEIVWHQAPSDPAKQIYDYVPVEVSF